MCSSISSTRNRGRVRSSRACSWTTSAFRLLEVLVRRGLLPHLVVERAKRVAIDHARGDVVGELFGLQIRKVRVNPDVSELVRDRGGQLVLVQRLSKIFFDRE